jgi:hypothetical protein
VRHIRGSVQLHICNDSTVMLVVDLHSTLINYSIDYSVTFSQTVALHNNATGIGNCFTPGEPYYQFYRLKIVNIHLFSRFLRRGNGTHMGQINIS